jgi:UDP-N-acetylmuramoyl-L-alanyl-D-glutamate--2,6-diaminopimelate ligase
MGRAARELADVVIVTDDNPRSENANSIRAAVMEGAGPHSKEVADRREAIYFAMQNLAAGDVLVIAGKGHEKIQIIGDQHYPFDDAEVARDCARELGQGA